MEIEVLRFRGEQRRIDENRIEWNRGEWRGRERERERSTQ
jgi:hypothetical protein